MKYRSAAAFSQALDDQLRQRARATGAALSRLRREVTFDRFLARLHAVAPDRFLVKGGVALEYRLEAARTTTDIDISVQGSLDDFFAVLREATTADLGDFFAVRLLGEPERPLEEINTYRFKLDILLGGRRFEHLVLDVGFADPWLDVPDDVAGPALLAFAEIPPTTVRVIPVPQHVAEKLHAYTRRYGAGESSRVKDLVDLVLLSSYRDVDGRQLHETIHRVFDTRGMHAVPTRFAIPPTSWRVSYRALTETLPVTRDLDEAHRLTAAFLDPILIGEAIDAVWSVAARSWQWYAR